MISTRRINMVFALIEEVISDRGTRRRLKKGVVEILRYGGRERERMQKCNNEISDLMRDIRAEGTQSALSRVETGDYAAKIQAARRKAEAAEVVDSAANAAQTAAELEVDAEFETESIANPKALVAAAPSAPDAFGFATLNNEMLMLEI